MDEVAAILPWSLSPEDWLNHSILNVVLRMSSYRVSDGFLFRNIQGSSIVGVFEGTRIVSELFGAKALSSSGLDRAPLLVPRYSAAWRFGALQGMTSQLY